ncbi:MAG TPA: hypothetical protein VE549_09105 [Myxococcaceae bacterium]|jgi:hypothetical protein|nr:hypothetical protein [Myxococcaceae bacterium]
MSDAGGVMEKRRIRLADGRTLIFFTFPAPPRPPEPPTPPAPTRDDV